MFIKTYNISDNTGVTLTAYISDLSNEMEHMKIKPTILISPGGAY